MPSSVSFMKLGKVRCVWTEGHPIWMGDHLAALGRKGCNTVVEQMLSNANSLMFNPQHLQVGLGKNAACNAGELLSVLVQLSIRQFPVLLGARVTFGLKCCSMSSDRTRQQLFLCLRQKIF